MNLPTRKTSGFTLIELMLVLMILTLVVSGLTTGFRAFGDGRRHKNLAAQFAALGRYARAQAIAEARTYRINIDDARAFYLTVDDGGDFIVPRGDFNRRFAVADDVTMTLDVPSTQDGTYIEFRATGMTDPSKIAFTNRFGEVVEVVCRTPTEAFEIVTPVAEAR